MKDPGDSSDLEDSSHSSGNAAQFKAARLTTCIAVGLAAGWMAWWVYEGPMTEPWDVGAGPYVAWLAAGGFVSVLIYPRSFLAGPLSTWAGQVLYAWIVYLPAAPPHNPVIILPSIATALYGLPPAYVGAVVPMVAHRPIERLWRRILPIAETEPGDDGDSKHSPNVDAA